MGMTASGVETAAKRVKEVQWSDEEEGGGQARRRTTAGHKEIRDIFNVQQAEPGDSAEGGDGLERVCCHSVMLARNDVQCVGEREGVCPSVVMWARPAMLQKQRHAKQAWWQLGLCQRGMADREDGCLEVYNKPNKQRDGGGQWVWVGAHREWLRWKRRAGDMGPDADQGEHVPWAPESYQPHHYYYCSGFVVGWFVAPGFVLLRMFVAGSTEGLEASKIRI
jgi:hypothetical protein